MTEYIKTLWEEYGEKKIELKRIKDIKTLNRRTFHIDRFFNWLDLDINCKEDLLKLKRVHASEYVAYLMTITKKPETIRTYINYMKSFFQYLNDWDYIDSNIFSRAEIPSEDVVKSDDELFMTPSQADLIIKTTHSKVRSSLEKPIRDRAMLALGCYGGLRIGETAYFETDWYKNYKHDDVFYVWAEKTRSRHKVVLSKKLRDILDEYISSNEYVEGKYLFGDGDGGHISERTIHDIFKKWFSRSKIDEDFTYHQLRKSFCGFLIEELKLDLAEATVSSRHRNISTFEKSYYRVMNRQKVMDKTKKLMKGVE